MPKQRTISLRVSQEFYDKLLGAAQGGSMTNYVMRAIEERMKGERPQPTLRQQKAIVDAQLSTSKAVNESIGEWMKGNPDWFERLPDDQKAKITAAWAAKFIGKEYSQDRDTVGLRECLESLPAMEDVTAELSRVKGELFKAERERDLMGVLLKRCGDVEGRRAYAGAVFEGVCEVVWQWIARNSVPGIGSGGGLTEKGREEVARDCVSWLERNVHLF